jgi:PAS domain S-box-containing protein
MAAVASPTRLPGLTRPRAPDAAITITRGGRVMDLNQGAERMFGVRRADVLRKPVAQTLAAADVDVAELGTLLSEDPSRLLDRDLEVTGSRRDGRPFVAELAVARAGSLYVVWIRDVSARSVADAASDGKLARLERAAVIAGAERRLFAREIAGHIAIEEVLAEWVPLDGGASRLLTRLGYAMDFAVGVLWVQRGAVLAARSCWGARASDASEFEGAERRLESGPAQALPVAAWLARQPVVVVSLPDAPPFHGRDAAVRSGLRGAVALPAVSGDLAFAVLEFYSRERLQPTETLLRSLAGMGHELGHFFARRSGELRPHELTAREREILQLTAQGMSGKVIAKHLSVSPFTVKSHFENIYAKWGVSDRAYAVAKALREGLIE